MAAGYFPSRSLVVMDIYKTFEASRNSYWRAFWTSHGARLLSFSSYFGSWKCWLEEILLYIEGKLLIYCMTKHEGLHFKWNKFFLNIEYFLVESRILTFSVMANKRYLRIHLLFFKEYFDKRMRMWMVAGVSMSAAVTVGVDNLFMSHPKPHPPSPSRHL